MSKFRETPITNCEKTFLVKCLSEWTRLDGRAFDEFRPLKIQFGKDWGCCCVSLGKTSVLAQTSCEIQCPKSSRPSEGILNINIELNPLAAPHFESGRQSELSVQLNRLLEKCIKDSKAVDLESLCIKMSEKVWALRVDVNVLNYEGNIWDCASVAVLASLTHFRRPDVTCDGEEFIIHSYQQRDPISTVIHHYPVSVTFAIFNDSTHIIADPSLIEENVADALLMVCLNGFKELCGFHLGGRAELTPQIILATVSKATSKASFFIEEIKNAIKVDNEARQEKKLVGFHVAMEFITTNSISSGASLSEWNEKKSKRWQKRKAKSEPGSEEIQVLDKGSAAYVPKDEIWDVEDHQDDLVVVNPKVEVIQIIESDSEDDNVIIIEN